MLRRRALAVLAALAMAVSIVVAGASAANAATMPSPYGTSTTVGGCAPYFPIKGNAGQGFVCLPNVVQGVEEDVDDAGLITCTAAGFALRPIGAFDVGVCVDSTSVVPGDYVFPTGGTTAGAATGSAICSASGLTSAVVTVGADDYVQCSGGTRAAAVSDSAAESKLNAIASSLATPAPATATISGSIQQDPTQYGLLFWTLLAGLTILLFLVGVSTAKTLFGR